MKLSVGQVTLAIIFNIALAVFGVWLFLDPSSGRSFFQIFIGIAFLIACIIIFFLYSRSEEKSNFQLVEAIGLAILAVIFLFWPSLSAIIVGIFLLIFVIYDGIINIRNAILYSKVQYQGWWIFLIYGFLSIIFGIILIFNLDITMNILIVIIGIYILVRSIMAIIDLISFRRRYLILIEKN